MKKNALVFFCLLICSVPYAQFHMGITGGLANYNGDLIDKYFVGKQTNGFIGATLHYEFRDQLQFRAGLTYGMLNGDDRYNSKQDLRARNLSFESRIFEFSIVGELYLFNLYEKRYSPYLFAGVALFHFDPYAYDSAGGKVFLKPLSTEGQGLYPDKPHYKKLQPAIPAGGGFKFALNDNIRIGIELGFRKTFTDYIDDVSTSYADANDLFAAKGQLAIDYSYRGDEVPGGDPAYPTKATQRGGAKQKDIYYFTGLNVSFRLGEGNSGSIFKPGGKNSRFGCPKVPQ